MTKRTIQVEIDLKSDDKCTGCHVDDGLFCRNFPDYYREIVEDEEFIRYWRPQQCLDAEIKQPWTEEEMMPEGFYDKDKNGQ